MYCVITVKTTSGRERYARFKSRLDKRTRKEVIKVEGAVVKLLPSRWNYSKTLESRIGCSKSHKSCAEKYFGKTIVEDDVVFPPAGLACWQDKVIPFAKSIGVDVVYGGTSAAIKRKHLGDVHRIPNCACDTTHYLVECNGAAGLFMYQLLSARAQTFLLKAPDDIIIDSWFASQTQKHNLKCVFVAPFVAKCEPCVSTIRHKHADYSATIDAREQVFIQRIHEVVGPPPPQPSTTADNLFYESAGNQ